MADEVVPVEMPVPVVPRPWYRSPRMWIAILTAVAAAGDAIAKSPVLGSQTAAFWLIGVSVLNMIARQLAARPSE